MDCHRIQIGKSFGTRMKIKVNKKAPNFELYSTSLKIFKLSNIKNGLIIYFYPRDNTPGCTLETKDFSKLYKKFKTLNYEVVGISKDNMKSHLAFKSKYRIPFHLLSDEKTKIQKKYGVWGIKSFMGKKFMGTIRSTVVINKHKILKIWSNVRVKNHAEEVLDFIKSTK